MKQEQVFQSTFWYDYVLAYVCQTISLTTHCYHIYIYFVLSEPWNEMHISSLMLCYQCKWEKEAYYQSPLLRSTHLYTVTGNKHLLVSRKQDILSPAYRRKQMCLPLQYWQVTTYAFERTSCSPVLSHKSLFLFVLPDTRQMFWRQQNFGGQGATGSFSEENWSVFVPLSKCWCLDWQLLLSEPTAVAAAAL